MYPGPLQGTGLRPACLRIALKLLGLSPGGGGGRVHPDLGDSTLSTLEAVSWRMGPEEAGRSAPRGRS